MQRICNPQNSVRFRNRAPVKGKTVKDVILVIFAFTLNPEGNPDQAQVFTAVHETMEECNRMGRNLREHLRLPKNVKSLSYCLSAKDLPRKE